MKIEKGAFVISKAGHDYNSLYVILECDDEYVYLSDGKIRTVENPKKKKIKHIQVTNHLAPGISEKIEQGAAIINEDIKRAIKMYKAEN